MNEVLCGCGYSFKVVANGHGVLNEHGLYSCDRWACRGCGNVLLHLAQEPCSRGAEAVEEAERWKARGITVYQKQGRF